MNYTKILMLMGAVCSIGNVYGTEYIATASNGAWGTGKSPAEAEKNCRKYKGNTCRTLTTNRGRTYFAIPSGHYIAVYRSQNNRFGVAYAGKQSDAWKIALNQCRNGGGFNCTHQNTWVAR